MKITLLLIFDGMKNDNDYDHFDGKWLIDYAGNPAVDDHFHAHPSSGGTQQTAGSQRLCPKHQCGGECYWTLPPSPWMSLLTWRSRTLLSFSMCPGSPGHVQTDGEVRAVLGMDGLRLGATLERWGFHYITLPSELHSQSVIMLHVATNWPHCW